MNEEKLTPRQQAIKDLLWDYLKKDLGNGHIDRVHTGFGTKTIHGLTACIERVFEETKTSLVVRGEEVTT